ncbi:MAG TPA: hypothetical protein VI451_04055 [Anaerolineales bacterium]|nr:hypothetical protein [Anaerolineales bacterium]
MEMVEGEPVEVVVTPLPEATALPYAGSGEEVLLSDEPGDASQLISAPPANRMVIKDAEMELLAGPFIVFFGLILWSLRVAWRSRKPHGNSPAPQTPGD